MPNVRSFPAWRMIVVLALASLGALAAPLAAAPVARQDPPDLQAAFRAAAHEFDVPESVLLALSYNLSRWEDHGGKPSVAGGYGVMHLTDARLLDAAGARGDGQRPSRTVRDGGSSSRLQSAAALLGVSADTLRHDTRQNIRGGAALLAQFARQAGGQLPKTEAGWFDALVIYSGSNDPAVAHDFANTVYATIRQGAARKTAHGQQVVLAAHDVRPNPDTARTAPQRQQPRGNVECPPALACEFIPAAYELNNPADPTDYGNYDLADRPRDGLDLRYIVIHDTEADYATTIELFQNPRHYAATHYTIRSSDGHVAQMVETKHVAWHAGNWHVNGHAIGIEHEGFAIEGAAWYTEPMYRASARLVRYLAARYNIPLDRAHIIGHDDIPRINEQQNLMHWDPGPYWDWEHYMQLLGAPIKAQRPERTNGIITIRPRLSTNLQTVRDCEGEQGLQSQPSNFVYLRSGPSFDAPYITNPYLKTDDEDEDDEVDDEVDPLCANNWGNKATGGLQFYRVAEQGDWDGVYFGGTLAWFYNPRQSYAVPSKGMLITPKAGRASIPVYGRASPEEAAYPPETTYQEVVPLALYSIPAGQLYVAFGPFKSSYYWAPTYATELEGSDHVVVTGEAYYQIFYNHRFAFVKASDVQVEQQR